MEWYSCFNVLNVVNECLIELIQNVYTNNCTQKRELERKENFKKTLTKAIVSSSSSAKTNVRDRKTANKTEKSVILKATLKTK